MRETGLNGLCPKESFASGREYAFRMREGINLLVHACRSTLFVFSYRFSIFSLLLLFLIFFLLFFLFSMLTHLVRLWFSFHSYYFLFTWSLHCARGFFIYCPPWLAFTILAFNYLYLVRVSLTTITSLLAIQLPLLIRADCATPHYQTKKIILFTCLLWHSYLPQCGYSLLLSLMTYT